MRPGAGSGLDQPVSPAARPEASWPRRLWLELGSTGSEPDGVIRLIIIERIAKSAVIVVVALTFLVFGRSGQLAGWVIELHEQLNLNVGSNLITRLIERGLEAIGVYRHFTALALGLLSYAALEGTEGVGLARRRRWAEYLTVVGTAFLIPYEVYEVFRHPTPFKVGALVLNAAIVCYLAYRKRLFVDV